MRSVALLLILFATPLAFAAPPALVAITGPAIHTTPEPTPIPQDPFPLRRVFVEADRLPALLKSLPAGPTVRLSLVDFEARVRAATLRQKATPAKLIEAKYTARHTPNGWQGQGSWRINNPSLQTELPLDSLQIPVQTLRLVNDRATRITQDSTGKPVLQLTPSVEEWVTFQWSAKALDDGSMERAEIVVPSAPMNLLELDLPADRSVELASPSLATLSGPLPGAPAGRERRQVLFGGQSRIEWTLTPPAAVDAVAPVVASRVSRFEFLQGIVNVSQDWSLEAIRTMPKDVAFTLDPRLTITNVTSPGRVRWAVVAGELRVSCADGLPAKLTVTGYAGWTPTEGQNFKLPEVNLREGALRSDMIEVTCRADVKWLGCEPGDYQPVALPSVPTTPETFRLGLAAKPRGSDTRVSPMLHLQSAAPQFSTTDDVTWFPGAESRLTATFRVQVLRGPLTLLPLRIPEGYRGVRAEQIPDDPTLTVSPAGIELNHAAMSGQTVEVLVELLGPPAILAVPTTFPRLEISGATEREGTLTIQPNPKWQATATLAPAITLANPARLRYPIRGRIPNAAVTFLERPATPIEPAVETQTPKPEPVGSAVIERVEQAIKIERDGTRVITITGVIVGDPRPLMPWPLPVGAEVQTLRLGGKLVEKFTTREGIIQLPSRTVATETSFQLRCIIPTPLGAMGGMVEVPKGRATAWNISPEYRLWPTLETVQDGTRLDRALRLVPANITVGLAWFTAALVLGLWLTLGLSRPRARIIIAVVAVLLVTLSALLPDGWAMLLRPTVLTLFLLLLWRQVTHRPVVVLGLVGILSMPSLAQAPEVATVWILPGPAGSPTTWQVLASQAVLDRLERTAQPELVPVVLTQAEYTGRTVDARSMLFEAVYTLENRSKRDEVWQLPLGGVRLESVTLDGQPAYPDMVKPDEYSITVPNGLHSLRVAFRVSTTVIAGQRETRFTTPDHPTTRLTITAPAALGTWDVPSRRGLQTLSTVAENLQATVEHGPGRQVILRQRDMAPVTAVVPTLREAHFWDIGPAESTLWGAYTLTSERNRRERLRLEVPEGWEPTLPQILIGDTRTLGTARSMKFSPLNAGVRTLDIEFLPTTSERVTVLVKFLPRATLSTKPVLRLPRVMEANVVESLAAVRLQNLTLDDITRDRLIDFPADEFLRKFSNIIEWQLDRAAPDRVFQRLDVSGPAELRPSIRSPQDTSPLSIETRWTLAPTVEMEAQVSLNRPTSVTLIELLVAPVIRLTDVRGPDVLSWSQRGNRLEVWFKRPVRQSTWLVSATGTFPTPSTSSTLDLPTLQGLQPSATNLRIRPPSGWAVLVTPGPGLARRADSTSLETIVTLDANTPSAKVTLTPPNIVHEVPRPPKRPVTVPPPVAPVAVVHPPEVVATPEEPAATWPTAIGWPAALLLLLLAARAGLPRPEGLVAGGVFAALFAGWLTPAGVVFWLVALAGVAWRGWRVAVHGSRWVLR
jgi:hypothetical protein